MRALELTDAWPARRVAVGVADRDGVLATHGDTGTTFAWASVTKLLTACAALLATEEGVLDLDAPAGPPGATARHLLAHASGLPFGRGRPLAPPGVRRIYSNAGFEVLGAVIAERSGMPFTDYLTAGVTEPLGLLHTGVAGRGSPAWAATGPLADLLALGRELLSPTLLATETVREATTVAFPGLPGVLPGFGRQVPNDWGLGFELRDAKSPHWTGDRNSAATFGHFGRTGTFLWVDPGAGLACACLTDLEFGDWARTAWPALSDAVLTEAGGHGVRANVVT